MSSIAGWQVGKNRLRRLAFCAAAIAACVAVAAGPAAKQPTSKPDNREARLAARHNSKVDEEAASLYQSADTTFLVGDPARAGELFKRVLDATPDSSYAVRATARMGDCAFVQHKFDEAAAFYRRAGAVSDSANNEEETIAGTRADFMVGQSYAAGKQYSNAFAQFRRFIDRHPGHALVNQAYQSIGDAHMAMEQYAQALSAYRMVGTAMAHRSQANRRTTPGQRLYLRVIDADVNVGDKPHSVFATIRTTSGDEEIIELEPIGVRSPVFIGTLPTSLGIPRHSGDVKAIFAESSAEKVRGQLSEADKLEGQARDNTREAADLDRSPAKIADPGGIEKRRAALVALAQTQTTRATSLRQEACAAVDGGFASFEKLLVAWAPDQSLETMKMRRPTTSPATSPTTAPDVDPKNPRPAEMDAELARPLAATDKDETLAPAAGAEQEQRGMSEEDLLKVRLATSTSPTTLENLDGRLAALSVWSRSLFRQFQRLEVAGGDTITIEYFDEIGPKGPYDKARGLRRDTVQVASDATIDILTADGREPLSQAVVGSDLLLRVRDADGDTSPSADTLSVVLAALPTADARALELAELTRPTSQPTSRRATPGEVDSTTQPATQPTLPLIPPGAASIKVVLKETAPHTGIFERIVHLGEDAIAVDGATLPIRDPANRTRLNGVRMAYEDARAVRRQDGWVLVRSLDCVGTAEGQVAAVRYRQSELDLEAKLRRAVAAGEIGKIYLDLGLDKRGRSYLASAQADCNEVAAAAEGASLGEEAVYHSWRVYFYAGLLDEAVGACRTLVARYPNSSHVDDAMFSMGEVSLERGQRLLDEAKGAGEKAGMNRELARAISQFDELVKKHPRSPRAPEAMFSIALAKVAAGQTGIDTFEALAKQYPDTIFAARGLAQAADYYMSAGDYRRAEEYYGRVLVDYPDSPNLGPVCLHRGMCQYKLGKVPEALQSFYRVSEEQAGTTLAGEAQKYIKFINEQRGGKEQ